VPVIPSCIGTVRLGVLCLWLEPVGLIGRPRGNGIRKGWPSIRAGLRIGGSLLCPDCWTNSGNCGRDDKGVSHEPAFTYYVR
jgi:hypothetical protein